jgi:hypothetical protein
MRGSFISVKQLIKHTPFVTVISAAQKTRVDVICHGFTRPWRKVMIVNEYSDCAMHNAIIHFECGNPAQQW